jgi:dCTP deaminase
MILSAQSIRRRGIFTPFSERTVHNGMSYGLSSCGYDVRIAEMLILWPGDFRLASTIEHFDVPNDVAALIKDKSTWARRGICCQNTLAEPGWRGHLTLEITNHSKDLITIHAGDPIAQVVLQLLDEPTEKPYGQGKYQNQAKGPQPAILEW